MKKSKNNKVIIIVSLVVTIFLILISVLSSRIPSSYIQTQATVTSYKAAYHGYSESLSYTTNSGQKETSSYTNYYATQVKSPLAIYYNPSNPKQIKAKNAPLEISLIIASVLIPALIAFRIIHKRNAVSFKK